MRADVATWFAERTLRAVALPGAGELSSFAGDGRISVVLPAVNEARTIGRVVSVLHDALVRDCPLISELIVLDGDSIDATATLAREAGAQVIALSDIPAARGYPRGKGLSLWASLQVTTGDIVVWIDADIEDVTPAFVTGLVAPLVLDPEVQFVKACYDRPLHAGTQVEATGGGRVTELLARPLLASYWPALTGFIQPLSGEYAGRRALLESVPFVSGYGVELALLVQVLERVGLAGMAQVDLGRRTHRNRPDEDLGRMAAGILATADLLRGQPIEGRELVQFNRAEGHIRPRESEVEVARLPPVASLVNQTVF